MRAHLVVAVAVALSGCYSVADHVRAQASGELDCPADQLEVQQQSGVIFRAHGCSQDVQYHCRRLPGIGLNCSQSSNPVSFVDAFVPSRAATATSGDEAHPPASAATPAPEAPAEPTVEATPPPASAQNERLVREQIDAQRDAVRACVGDTVVAVRVEWDATGATTVSLTGARSGTAEERCVQESLGELSVDEPEEGGTVLHPVR